MKKVQKSKPALEEKESGMKNISQDLLFLQPWFGKETPGILSVDNFSFSGLFEQQAPSFQCLLKKFLINDWFSYELEKQ